MVNKDRLDSLFHALADATRRGILEEIARGNPTVAELGRPFEMSAPAISKHLKVLERAELVTRVKEGTVNRFRLKPEALEEAAEEMGMLARIWLERANGIGEVVEEGELEDYLM